MESLVYFSYYIPLHVSTQVNPLYFHTFCHSRTFPCSFGAKLWYNKQNRRREKPFCPSDFGGIHGDLR